MILTQFHPLLIYSTCSNWRLKLTLIVLKDRVRTSQTIKFVFARNKIHLILYTIIISVNSSSDMQCFSTFFFFRGGTPKVIVHIPRIPCLWKQMYIYTSVCVCVCACKETDFNAWRLLKYFQLEIKILAIFWGIFIIFVVFQNTNVFIPLFLSEPQMVFCGTLRFRETQFEIYWLHEISKYTV